MEVNLSHPVLSHCLLAEYLSSPMVASWTTIPGKRAFRNYGSFLHLKKSGGLVAESCPTLATPKTAACQVPLSMGFSRQKNWSGLPFPSPGDIPDPGDRTWVSALQADSLPPELWGKPGFRPNPSLTDLVKKKKKPSYITLNGYKTSLSESVIFNLW